MLATIGRLFSRPKAPPHPLTPYFERVTKVLGPEIATASDFEVRLGAALQGTLGYLDGQLDAIPGPIDISHAALITNAELRTLFPEPDDLLLALGRSLEVKDTLPGLIEHGHTHIYALLGMRNRPKQKSGPTQLVDHTVRSLAPSEGHWHEYLREVAFMRLLTNFSTHVDKLRRQERLLKLEWDILSDTPTNPEAPDSREFVYATKELTPDNMLRGLVAWLHTPAHYLRLEPSAVSISADGKPLPLPLLHSSDRRQWLSCLIRFPISDAQAALARETRAHRYIFI